MLFSMFFPEEIALSFRFTRECLFPLPVGATIFAKLRSKIAKTPDLGEKFERTTLYR